MPSRVCPWCGRRVRTVVPGGGDGSVEVFVRHGDGGAVCEGSRREVPAEDAPGP